MNTPSLHSPSCSSYSDIFEYLEVRRADAVELLIRLRSFFRITAELNADLSKKSQLQHFYLQNLTDHDSNVADAINALGDHFDDFSKGVSKFSTDCRDLIHKPLRVYVRSYRLSTLKIVYRIRKLQCLLGVEVRKAQQMKTNPRIETSEALNEKCLIQHDKCNDLLFKTQQQIEQLVNEFKRLELDRIHRVKAFLWTFHQLMLNTWSFSNPQLEHTNERVDEFKKEILAIEPMASIDEIDKQFQSITLEDVREIESRNAAKYWLRTCLREIFLS